MTFSEVLSHSYDFQLTVFGVNGLVKSHSYDFRLTVFRVCDHMNFHIALLGKGFSTDFTLEWLLPCVDPNVIPEVGS